MHKREESFLFFNKQTKKFSTKFMCSDNDELLKDSCALKLTLFLLNRTQKNRANPNFSRKKHRRDSTYTSPTFASSKECIGGIA
uniref:Ovule protein n=1 Tax=Globodera rostochiensis TaxID=31243 RepID=A0A914I8E4_GLORO